MTREEFLLHFRITDAKLNQLVRDLMDQPDTPNNRGLLQKALRGTYTANSSLNNFITFFAQDLGQGGANGADDAEKKLIDHLKVVKKTEPSYDALLEKAKKGAYSSTVAPEVVSPYDFSAFVEEATVPKPERVSREAMLSHYSSKEPGYNLLVADLMKLPATEMNYLLLERLVDGEYSEYHSTGISTVNLTDDLGVAVRENYADEVVKSTYNAMIEKAYKDNYEHNYSPLKDGVAQNNTTAADVMIPILEMLMASVDESVEQPGNGPSFF